MPWLVASQRPFSRWQLLDLLECSADVSITVFSLRHKFNWFCMVLHDIFQSKRHKTKHLWKGCGVAEGRSHQGRFCFCAVASNNISTYHYYQYFLPGDRRPHWQIQERRLPQKVFLEPCNIEWWKLRSATRLCKDFRRTGMSLEVDMLFKWQTTKYWSPWFRVLKSPPNGEQ